MSFDIVERLRDQAQASGHRWVDVMQLLLESAKEIERLRGLWIGAGDRCPQCGIGITVLTEEAKPTGDSERLRVARQVLEQIAETPRNAGARRNARAALAFLDLCMNYPECVNESPAPHPDDLRGSEPQSSPSK